MRYKEPASGEWVQPVRRGYKMRCCDCDLVHRLDFRIVNGRVQFRVFRDERATGACRRGRVKLIGSRDWIDKAKAALGKVGLW